MLIAFFVIAVVVLLYVLSTIGSGGHRKLSGLRGWVYAHRGLHGQGIPENSLAAFRRAKNAGYGIELDIHLLKDGNLAVIHDSQLKRTTGASGRIEDLTTDQLKDYYLEGTDQTIPQFQQVLNLFAGNAPLIVELKCVDNNYAELCKTACNMLDSYKGLYCVESFDPRCIYWLRKNRPDIIRGQLTENFFASKSSKLPWYLKFVLRHQMLNFLTRPDFVAYRFSDRKDFSYRLCTKFWKTQSAAWTINTPADCEAAQSENSIIIFENFKP